MTNYSTKYALIEKKYGTYAANKWMQTKMADTKKEDSKFEEQKRQKHYVPFDDYADKTITDMYELGFLNIEIADYMGVTVQKVTTHLYYLIKNKNLKKITFSERRSRHDVLKSKGVTGRFENVNLFRND